MLRTVAHLLAMLSNLFCSNNMLAAFQFLPQKIALPNFHVLNQKICKNKIRLFSSFHRLERIVSNRGIGSRTEVAKLLRQGRISVNGKVIKSGSVKYSTDVIISVDGKQITELPLLAVYHKPVNVICSIGDPWGRTSLTTLFTEYPFLKNMHPVGRLDLDTSGLLLFSKDGKLTQHLLNPQSKINRIYEARVVGKVNFDELKIRLNIGVNTTDGLFPAELLHCEYYEEAPNVLVKIQPFSFESDDDDDDSENHKPLESSEIDNINASNTYTNVTTCSLIRLSVMEGKYRMVRRILHNSGHSVIALHRIQYGNIKLDTLVEGSVRNGTELEIEWASNLLA